MNWSAKIGIALIPLIFFAAWLLYGGSPPPQPSAFSTFVHEGNLIKDNPGFVPGIWYLSFEVPGEPAKTVALLFDHDSRCGNDENLRVCNISFEHGERVRIEGVQTGDAILVHHLIYLR